MAHHSQTDYERTDGLTHMVFKGHATHFQRVMQHVEVTSSDWDYSCAKTGDNIENTTSILEINHWKAEFLSDYKVFF